MYLTSPSVDSVQNQRYSTNPNISVPSVRIMIRFCICKKETLKKRAGRGGGPAWRQSYNYYVIALLSTHRLQGSERDRRSPGQSSRGGAGLRAGQLGVDLLLKQSSNHPLVSYCCACVHDDLYQVLWSLCGKGSSTLQVMYACPIIVILYL